MPVSQEDALFHGEVVGIQDVVTFQSETADGLNQAFAESVDDYLEFRQQRGQSPEQTPSQDDTPR